MAQPGGFLQGSKESPAPGDANPVSGQTKSDQGSRLRQDLRQIQGAVVSDAIAGSSLPPSILSHAKIKPLQTPRFKQATGKSLSASISQGRRGQPQETQGEIRWQGRSQGIPQGVGGEIHSLKVGTLRQKTYQGRNRLRIKPVASQVDPSRGHRGRPQHLPQGFQALQTGNTVAKVEAF
jgi:hypothetical protein